MPVRDTPVSDTLPLPAVMRPASPAGMPQRPAVRHMPEVPVRSPFALLRQHKQPADLVCLYSHCPYNAVCRILSQIHAPLPNICRNFPVAVMIQKELHGSCGIVLGINLTNCFPREFPHTFQILCCCFSNLHDVLLLRTGIPNLFLENSLASPSQLCYTISRQDRLPVFKRVFILRAMPHKDCATEASSNFSSDETKSGVNT